MQQPGWRLRRLVGSGGALLVAMAMVLGGCQHTPPVAPVDWPDDLEPVLRVQAGDQLLVSFTYTPELNEEQLVRPDGMISLPLVGGVLVAGKSPEEIREELGGLYTSKLREPEINVVIRGLESHKVYVSGEVLRPGVVPMTGPMTALQAVMYAGGFETRSAKTRTVVVLRQRGERQYGRTIDLRAELEGNVAEPFQLEPFDIVFVPRTGIDRANQWVDQYINRMIPDNVNFGLNYTFFREVAKQDQDQRNITVAP